MAPITTASDESTHQALMDQLDMFPVLKPFRNPNWRPAGRRNKNLKQILSEASRKEQSILNTQNNSGTSTPAIASATETGTKGNTNGTQELGRMVAERTLQPQAPQQQLSQSLQAYSYTSMTAAPSFKSKSKYCDITGLPARYIDPKSGLRYHNREVYAVVKTLGTSTIQEYLAARGAHTVLK